MNTNVGIWIDHKQAIIVAVTGKELHIGQIASNTERQQRRSGDSQLKNSLKPRRAIADDIQLRSYTGHINRYYDSVIAYIGNAEAIMIFGPGEAKGELKKRLEKNGLGGRIAAVEAADKMTKPQIAAKVRKHFCK
jgi:hypothetical protein